MSGVLSAGGAPMQFCTDTMTDDLERAPVIKIINPIKIMALIITLHSKTVAV